MSQAATNRERSPLRESSEHRQDRDCKSESTTSSRRSPSPVVHLVEASSDSCIRERVHLREMSYRPPKTLHRMFDSRSHGGRSNVNLTEDHKSTDLLLNGRKMVELLRQKKGRIGAAPRHSSALGRSSRHSEDDRAEVTSSTPRIPDRKLRRSGEESESVEERRQDEGCELNNPACAGAEQFGQWVASSETPATRGSVLGAMPVKELMEPMNCHVAYNNDNFGKISPINVTSPITAYNPLCGYYENSFYVPPVIPSYKDTHYRRPSKHQVEKPIVEHGRTGTVANYNCSEGFGFITAKSTIDKLPITGNLFVHHSSLQIPSLTKGAEVKFDVAQGPRGHEAVNVSLLSDEMK